MPHNTSEYVLIARTRGDLLITSKNIVIAVSADRSEIETLRDKRAQERSGWLAANPLPSYAYAGVIAEETIHEVPTASKLLRETADRTLQKHQSQHERCNDADTANHNSYG